MPSLPAEKTCKVCKAAPPPRPGAAGEPSPCTVSTAAPDWGFKAGAAVVTGPGASPPPRCLARSEGGRPLRGLGSGAHGDDFKVPLPIAGRLGSRPSPDRLPGEAGSVNAEQCRVVQFRHSDTGARCRYKSIPAT
ncbi:unnamed protein product [Lampetra planeri]